MSAPHLKKLIQNQRSPKKKTRIDAVEELSKRRKLKERKQSVREKELELARQQRDYQQEDRQQERQERQLLKNFLITKQQERQQ